MNSFLISFSALQEVHGIKISYTTLGIGFKDTPPLRPSTAIQKGHFDRDDVDHSFIWDSILRLTYSALEISYKNTDRVWQLGEQS